MISAALGTVADAMTAEAAAGQADLAAVGVKAAEAGLAIDGETAAALIRVTKAHAAAGDTAKVKEYGPKAVAAAEKARERRHGRDRYASGGRCLPRRWRQGEGEGGGREGDRHGGREEHRPEAVRRGPGEEVRGRAKAKNERERETSNWKVRVADRRIPRLCSLTCPCSGSANEARP